MPKAFIFEFNAKSKTYEPLGELTLAAIPNRTDRITIEIKKKKAVSTFILYVEEIHYADNKKVDIFTSRISSILDYKVEPPLAFHDFSQQNRGNR